MDDDDRYFFVGGLRCKTRADWLVLIGVTQLPKALQKSVRIRVDEDLCADTLVGWVGWGGRSWVRVAASGERTGLSERCPGA